MSQQKKLKAPFKNKQVTNPQAIKLAVQKERKAVRNEINMAVAKATQAAENDLFKQATLSQYKKRKQRVKLSKYAAYSAPPAFQLSLPMAKYLDMVCNPLSAVDIVQCPSNKRERTLPMMDFIPPTLLTLTADPSQLGESGNASGVVLWFQFGYSAFLQGSPWQTTQPLGTNYSVFASIVNDSGQLASASSSNFDVFQLTFTNHNTIVGGDNYDFQNYDGLVKTLKLSSLGFRALPQIEWLTDSSTKAVAQFWGGHITQQDMWDSFWDVDIGSPYKFDSFITELDTLPYANNQGVSVRINPFQEKLQPSYTMQQMIGSIVAADTTIKPMNDFSGVAVPFIYAKFNQLIAPTATGETFNTFVLPFYFDCRMILETSLLKPTPLVSSLAPVDPDYDKVYKIINAQPDAYCPYVTEGHSFRSFWEGSKKFVSFANKFLNYGTSAVPLVNNLIRGVDNLLDDYKS